MVEADDLSQCTNSPVPVFVKVTAVDVGMQSEPQNSFKNAAIMQCSLIVVVFFHYQAIRKQELL